jgi:protein-disulfide isomerase
MKNLKEVIPVIPSKDIVIGEASAPVTLVMFGDYESEATARANKVVIQLLEEYSGKINFVFRHFPMTRIHQKAHKAAEAAIGAAQEGKFWEMHQYLFANPKNLGVISLKSHAREVGVVDKKFLDHLINSDWGWFVQDDLRAGLELGITDIPALFVNDVLFEKELTLKNLELHINALLKEEEQGVITLKKTKRA